jgi:hypothetical protein
VAKRHSVSAEQICKASLARSAKSLKIDSAQPEPPESARIDNSTPTFGFSVVDPAPEGSPFHFPSERMKLQLAMHERVSHRLDGGTVYYVPSTTIKHNIDEPCYR